MIFQKIFKRKKPLYDIDRTLAIMFPEGPDVNDGLFNETIGILRLIIDIRKDTFDFSKKIIICLNPQDEFRLLIKSRFHTQVKWLINQAYPNVEFKFNKLVIPINDALHNRNICKRAKLT